MFSEILILCSKCNHRNIEFDDGVQHGKNKKINKLNNC